MTVFHSNVFKMFCRAVNIKYVRCHPRFCLPGESKRDMFYRVVKEMTEPTFVVLPGIIPDFEKLPPYLGSHFVRDPRDLLVSAYRYHKWCKEPWLAKDIPIKNSNAQQAVTAAGIDPQSKSYQQVLSEVDEITGYKIELRNRGWQFDNMKRWNYNNPLILESKYENIFGNEVEEFSKLYNHYELPPEHYPLFKKCVKKFTFKFLKSKNKTGPGRHAEVGTPQQWKTLLPTEIYNMFMDEYEDLITMLNYEH